MKRLVLMISLFMSILCSCEKELPAGGYTKQNIYILIGDVPVDAQDYVLTIPSDRGEYDVPFLTYGISHLKVVKSAPGIEVSAKDNYPFREDYAYQWGYKEYVHIKAEANNGKKSRKVKFTLYAEGGNGNIADIKIVQEGR